MRNLLLALLLLTGCATPEGGAYDLVLAGGRVLDPETGLDAVRDVGLRDGRIAAVSPTPLSGREILEARGLVVAPGFIDLHAHAQDPEGWALKAQDGFTTALELEVGTADVDAWLGAREGKSPIHVGVSAGHIPVRMAVLGDPEGFLPRADGRAAGHVATTDEIAAIRAGLKRELDRGALAVGMGLAYTPAASPEEVLEVFRAARASGAAVHVHARRSPSGTTAGLDELLTAARETGAGLHLVHVTSTGAKDTERFLRRIDEARASGLDATTECYPYTAGMTDIASPIYDPGWREARGLDYGDLLWPATGERLTKESFERYRKQGGLVALFSIPEAAARAGVGHPGVMIASDSIRDKGRWHPRSAGTAARVLGRYVREEKALSLMDAVAKLSLLPARRLERRCPDFRRKGRVQPGCDADLAVFDPATVIDRATYERPTEPSQGVRHVLVSGVPVVRDGRFLPGVHPGRALRAR
ncbi:MAG TPA: amidohydrolase family protein [Planctomycetota bacterium]|nr:amidohydrolase family protein [Planctomycetota bacterium]